MQIVFLAGGLGTRLSELTTSIPKPMIDIGGLPIIVHIMKYYSHFGFKDFVICAGYKQEVIKDYFVNYYRNNANVTIKLKTDEVIVHSTKMDDWTISIIDTGLNTLTSGRIKQIEKYIDGDTFGLTYSDGLSDVDLHALLNYHNEHGKIATLTAVQPKARFGSLKLDENFELLDFTEKINDNVWINGGFFFFNKQIFNYFDDDMLEKNVLPNLLKDNQLQAFKHEGFWQCVDNTHDKHVIDTLWAKGEAKWKVW